jgi:sulfate/thiosulfate transport system permease protein
MSAFPRTAEPAKPTDLPGRGKRRLVRGGIVGLCFVYVGVLLLLPLVGIIWTALKPGLHKVVETLQLPDVQHAFYLTGVITAITLIVTTFFGVITAWVLVRQRFPGKSLLNALVDLPFALSPVTVGLAATILFGLGGWLYPFFDERGIKILFALPSMVLVTIFICIPFTIREIVPVLQEIGKDEEDAARTLGASILQTWRKVTMPNIRWGLLYGVALTTARSIGEIGAVLIVSGIIKGKTETATLFIFTAIEERQASEAYIVALILAAVSIILLVTIEAARHRIEGRKVRT